MLSQAVDLVLLGLVSLATLAVMVESARRPMVIVYAMLGVYAWSLVRTTPFPTTSVVGISVNVIDVVQAIAFGAALVRLRRGPRAWQWALLVVVALIVTGALRGALHLGNTAMLGFRAELYFVVPALFVSTLAAGDAKRVVRAVVIFGGSLAALAIVRWLMLAAGFTLTPLASSGGLGVERVINSSATLWVAFAGVVGVAVALRKVHGRRPWSLWVLTGATLGVVLFAQHRSVWIAVAVMFALALVTVRKRWYTKAGVVIVAVIFVVVIEGRGLGDVGVVGESFAAAASDARTWEWRVERWATVWDTHAARGFTSIMVGSGYGYGWTTGALGVWEASPHNGYLQLAVRIGLLGALLVVLAYAAVLRGLSRRAAATEHAVWLWTVGSLVYYIPYSADAVTGVVLGTALTMIRAERRAKTEQHALTQSWSVERIHEEGQPVPRPES